MANDKRETPNRIAFHKNYARIYLNGATRKCTYVDIADLDKVKNYSWTLGNTGYAKANLIGLDGQSTSINMQTVILGRVDGYESDHKNHNRLDNRVSTGNLRLLTHSENQINREKYGKLSKYRGVRRVCVKGKYVVYQAVLCNEYLGSYPTEEEAAMAYDLGLMLCFPGVAKTNLRYKGAK